MKQGFRYTVLSLLALAGLSTSAQILDEDTTTHQPFFKATKFSSRCYVGLEGEAVQILKTKAGGYFGANLNWVVNHSFVVSAIYEELGSSTKIQSIVTPQDSHDTITLTHRYVGLGFSYIA